MYCSNCINEDDRIDIPTESGIEKTEFIRIANDGGSHSCNSCEVLFHYCVNGVKYGSPGPKMCGECKPISGQPISGDNMWVMLDHWWVDANGDPIREVRMPASGVKYYIEECEKNDKPADTQSLKINLP